MYVARRGGAEIECWPFLGSIREPKSRSISLFTEGEQADPSLDLVKCREDLKIYYEHLSSDFHKTELPLLKNSARPPVQYSAFVFSKERRLIAYYIMLKE